MEKNLPKVYANPINKPITNNREYQVTNTEERKIKTMENIPQEINRIFANPHHVYKSKVKLVIGNQEEETTIVGKTSDYLLTLTGEKIRINDIDYIERI